MTILEGNELILRCREIHDIAQKCSSEVLLGVLRSVGGEVQCYTFKSRHKSPNAIRKKVQRKRREGPALTESFSKTKHKVDHKNWNTMIDRLCSYNPDHVTDAWGCRYVTLYQSEIPRTVEVLLKKLEEFNQTEVAPVQMTEFVIYTNRPITDPLSIVEETVSIVSRSGFANSVVVDGSNIREPESRKSAYSSVHFVFDRDVQIEHPGRDEVNEIASFEVQIRDIFEEGWGEVQHHLLYSEKDSLDLDETGVNPQSAQWVTHLNALKTFVDGCSQHASIIKWQRDVSRMVRLPSLEGQSATPRVKDREDILTALRRNGTGREALKSVSTAYDLLISAESFDEPESTIGKYWAAAVALKNALQNLAKKAKTNVHSRMKRNVAYFLEMELANCYSACSNAKKNLIPGIAEGNYGCPKTADELSKMAINYYRKIVSSTNDDATSRVRLAKALCRTEEILDHVDEVVTLSEHAVNLVGNDPITGPNHWIQLSAYTQMGYALWCRYKLIIDTKLEDRLQVLERALEKTKCAYDIWVTQKAHINLTFTSRLVAHKAVSNILFYAAELEKLTAGDKETLRSEIKDFIEVLRTLKVDSYRDFFRTKDNLMHAQLALGNTETARTLAIENFCHLRSAAERRAARPLERSKIESFLRKSEEASFFAAQDLLFGTGLEENL